MSEYLEQGGSNFSPRIVIDSANLESLSVKAFSTSKCITTNFSACYLYLCVRLYPLSLALSTPILHLLLIHCFILHLKLFIFPPPSAIPARISITSTLLSTIAYKHVLCQLRKMFNISMLQTKGPPYSKTQTQKNVHKQIHAFPLTSIGCSCILLV